MKLTQTLSVVYCIIRVVWCWIDFSITLPETVEAVSGHCVLIPCQFEIELKYDLLLKDTSIGKWLKDGTEINNVVFDSSTPENNQIEGNITGDLNKNNCTTIFTSISPNSSGSYYFRIERGLKLSFKNPHVYINVSDSPPKPTLSLNVDQKEVNDLENVMEGSSVNLICSALAPCPSNPPTLTWTNVPSNISVQEIQNTTFNSSHLNFTASHLHDGNNITCSASYQLEDKTTKRVSRSRLLRVLYPPRDTSVSVVPPSPVLLGSSVSLNCSSDGNPAVLNFIWYRENGEQIGTGNTLNITETNHTHSGLYYCSAQNTHGTHNSSVLLDVHYPPRNTSVSVVPPGPVLLGSSVSLNCSSDGNPAVLNFTWYRENGEQIGTGDTLNITQTNHTHSGLYYCRAQNTHGTHNSSVQLDVHFSPQASLSSHCNSSDGGILCVCEVHGFPVPKLEWRLSGSSVSLSVNQSIREEPVGSADLRSIITISPMAAYTPTLQCIGSNYLGSTSAMFSLVYIEQKQTLLLYLILTALLLLSASINGFLIYKLKQQSIRTKNLKVDADTYASLQLTTQDSDYETLQHKRGRKMDQEKS